MSSGTEGNKPAPAPPRYSPVLALFFERHRDLTKMIRRTEMKAHVTFYYDVNMLARHAEPAAIILCCVQRAQQLALSPS